MANNGTANSSSRSTRRHWSLIKLALGIPGMLMAGQTSHTMEELNTNVLNTGLSDFEKKFTIQEEKEDPELTAYKTKVQKTVDKGKFSQPLIQQIESDPILNSIRKAVQSKKGNPTFSLKETATLLHQNLDQISTFKLYCTLKNANLEPATITIDELNAALKTDTKGISPSVEAFIEAVREFFGDSIKDPQVQACLDPIWQALNEDNILVYDDWAGGPASTLVEKHSTTIKTLRDKYINFQNLEDDRELPNEGLKLIADNTYNNKPLASPTIFQQKLKEIPQLQETLEELKAELKIDEKPAKYETLRNLMDEIKEECNEDETNKIIAQYNAINVFNPAFKPIEPVIVDEKELTYLALDQAILQGPTAEQLQEKIDDMKLFMQKQQNELQKLLTQSVQLRKKDKNELQAQLIKLQEAKDELQTKHEELQKATDALSQTKNELSTAKTALSKKAEELTQTEQILKNTKNDLKSAQNSLNSTKAELATKESTLKATQKELEKSQTTLSTTQDQLNKAQQALTESDKKIQQYMKDMDAQKKKYEKTQEDLATIQQKLTEYHNLKFPAEIWKEIGNRLGQNGVTEEAVNAINSIESLAQIINNSIPKEFEALVKAFNLIPSFKKKVPLSKLMTQMAQTFQNKATIISKANERVIEQANEIQDLKEQLEKLSNKVVINQEEPKLGNTLDFNKDNIDIKNKKLNEIKNSITDNSIPESESKEENKKDEIDQFDSNKKIFSEEIKKDPEKGQRLILDNKSVLKNPEVNIKIPEFGPNTLKYKGLTNNNNNNDEDNKNEEENKSEFKINDTNKTGTGGRAEQQPYKNIDAAKYDGWITEEKLCADKNINRTKKKAADEAIRKLLKTYDTITVQNQTMYRLKSLSSSTNK